MDPWILTASLVAALWLVQIVLFLATFARHDSSPWG